MTLEELNRHRDLREKLINAQELYQSLLASAEPGGQRLDGMPHAPGVSDKVGNLGAELADLSARIEFHEAEIKKSEEDILSYINSIEDDQTRMIFRLRFVRCLAWGEVADIIGGWNTEASVKTICYRYLSSETCNAELRDDAP